MFACPRGDKLIEDQLSIQVQNNKAIINASKLGNFQMIKLLIKSGADVEAKNNRALSNQL